MTIRQIAAQILGMFLSAGCSTVLLTYWLAAHDRQRDDREASSLVAIQVASDLEDYARQCADIANEYDAPGNPRSGLAKHLPPLPMWRTTQDWRGLSTADRDRILSLRIRAAEGASYVDSAVKYARPDDVVQAVRDEAVLLGSTAWQLAGELRSDTGYAPLRLHQSFGPDLLRLAAKLTAQWRTGGDAGVDPR